LNVSVLTLGEIEQGISRIRLLNPFEA